MRHLDEIKAELAKDRRRELLYRARSVIVGLAELGDRFAIELVDEIDDEIDIKGLHGL